MFFRLFTDLPHVPMVAIENPAGIMTRMYRRPDQYVQPWWFGDAWTKRTGLWLKGLPLLVPDQPVKSQGPWVGSQRAYVALDGYRVLSGEGSRVLGGVRTNEGRAHARGKTFPGVARAMAEQWG